MRKLLVISLFAIMAVASVSFGATYPTTVSSLASTVVGADVYEWDCPQDGSVTHRVYYMDVTYAPQGLGATGYYYAAYDEQTETWNPNGAMDHCRSVDGVSFSIYNPTFTDSSGGGKTYTPGGPGEITVCGAKVVFRHGVNGGDTNFTREVWVSDDGGAVYDYQGVLDTTGGEGCYTNQIVHGANMIYKGECYQYALFHHYGSQLHVMVSQDVPVGTATGGNWTGVGQVAPDPQGCSRIAICKDAVDAQGGTIPYLMTWARDGGGVAGDYVRYIMSKDGMNWANNSEWATNNNAGTINPLVVMPGLDICPTISGVVSVRHRVVAFLYDADRFDHAGSSDGAKAQYRIYGTIDDNNAAGGVYDRSTFLAIMENLRADVGGVEGTITMTSGSNTLADRELSVNVVCKQSGSVVFEKAVATTSKYGDSATKYYTCYGIPNGTYDIDIVPAGFAPVTYSSQTISSEVALGAGSVDCGDLVGATVTDPPNGVVNVIDLNAIKQELSGI
jgi:hypothetical protein